MLSPHNWLLASRPKTLVAAVVPVVIGAAYAGRSVTPDLLIAACAMLAALCIQIGTNLANDYSDYKRGADTERRLGPVRVTQAGLIEPSRVKAGAIMAFMLAAAFGIPLVLRGGLPILAIGILSVLCGWAYTGGPKPLGYLGLGELFVFLFFGVAATVGTSYVLALKFEPLSLLIAVVPGLHAGALLAINNLRDIETDRAAGKRTLAVRFGRGFARVEYALLVLLPFMIPLILMSMPSFRAWILLPLLCLPLAKMPLSLAFTRTDGPGLIRALAGTARLQLIFGILFAIGLVA